MDKKTFLCRYHNILEKIERKKEYIAFCDERSHSIPTQDFTQPKVDSTPSGTAPFVRWLYKKMEAEEELAELKKEADTIKSEIEAAIATIGDEFLEMLLVYRYIDWLTWPRIWEKLYISESTQRRWHAKALEKMTVYDGS
ncbi:MAG: hypothetical protein IK034_01220 [Bacilli bacterium]|nr:hypothetical protein [Bacilli bacterium]